MNDQFDEINKAIQDIKEKKVISNSIGNFVFRPIIKPKYSIRHINESMKTNERYSKYLQKIGRTNISDFNTRFKTKTSVNVSSIAELIIANTLTDLGIE